MRCEMPASHLDLLSGTKYAAGGAAQPAVFGFVIQVTIVGMSR